MPVVGLEYGGAALSLSLSLQEDGGGNDTRGGYEGQLGRGDSVESISPGVPLASSPLFQHFTVQISYIYIYKVCMSVCVIGYLPTHVID